MAAVDDLVSVLHHVATCGICRGSWQLSIPTFVNRGSSTPPNVPPMSTYLLNDDCISFIKRFYDQCDTIEQLCNNEYCHTIVDADFGKADEGWSVLDALTDDQYDLL